MIHPKKGSNLHLTDCFLCRKGTKGKERRERNVWLVSADAHGGGTHDEMSAPRVSAWEATNYLIIFQVSIIRENWLNCPAKCKGQFPLMSITCS